MIKPRICRSRPTGLWAGYALGRYGEVGVLNDKYFFREYNMFIVIRSCLMYPMMVIQTYITYIQIKYTKNVIMV